MKKYLLFLLLVLFACQPGLRQTQLVDVHTGTSGLELKFFDTNLVDVFESSYFDMLIELRNHGAANINEGKYVWITEENYVVAEGRTSKGVFDLQGRTPYDPSGGFSVVESRMTAKLLPQLIKGYDTPVIFLACYPYKTNATVHVCIDTDIQQANPRKVCKPDTINLRGGQGAPVAIESVEQIFSRDQATGKIRPTFVINMRNLGNGHVVDSSLLDVACGSQGGLSLLRGTSVTGEIGSAGFNKVSVSASLPSGDLDCGVNPAILLEKGKDAAIICRVNDNALLDVSAGTFTSLLSIKINYGYVTSKSFMLTIKKFI
ncbi:hypothetical protein COV18_03490 [Candidatus Woesearchaeota archaeon CG10_big_fil_rev_8_21_14_0_10_37_12]|nr:MAG: hypothetical protein COV18_03490 [Candidatus Woesearchaeota archaeon CG10_big_fil_rev_8_21_14_0_10_37_12]